MKKRDLLVEVHRIRGTCPVFREGEGFEIRDGHANPLSAPAGSDRMTP